MPQKTKALNPEKEVKGTELAISGLKREGVSSPLFPHQSSTSRSGAIITKLTQQDCPIMIGAKYTWRGGLLDSLH